MEQTSYIHVKTIGERFEAFLRGDWWRVIILGVLCTLMIVPLIMAFFISLKTIPQFSRNPFGLSFPLHWENYSFAWMIVRQFILNSIIAYEHPIIHLFAYEVKM